MPPYRTLTDNDFPRIIVNDQSQTIDIRIAMTKTTFATTVAAFFFAMTLLAGSGCSSLPGKLSLPTWGGTSSPTKIVAIWDPVVRQENDTSYRGFAARIMFYDSSSGKKAMRARGNFDVYAFDEDDPKQDRVTPTRIIRFQVDNLKNLESDSKLLGKSYTIWVPWDEATPDSRKKNISLIVRFKCNDGNTVMSQMAKVNLPGMMQGEDKVEDTVYVNPYQDEKNQQMAKLNALAEKQRNNPNSLDTEWKGTVAEHVITRETRPEMMLTRTMNVPGYSRDGVVPIIKPEYNFASATDEQKYLAQLMIANTQTVQNQQVIAAASNPPLQNPNYPIDQVQFQSSGSGDAAYLQPMFQPNYQPTFQPVQQPPVDNPQFGNYAAANPGTVLR